MRTAILSANLGGFDTPPLNLNQKVDHFISEHIFTDDDFPPITGLTPRFQYRIPKLFGWQMLPGYDIYIWHDSSMSLIHQESAKWFIDQLGDADMAFFKHPWRNTIKEEVDHVEQKLQEGNKYITSRYKNGLHKEQYAQIIGNPSYVDDKLYASTAFAYRNTEAVRLALADWWLQQSRYFTVDQIALPYVIRNLKVNMLTDDLFKNHPYIGVTSAHK